MTTRVLLLAGTREARKLCAGLAHLPELDVTASLAGADTNGEDYPVDLRRGGFGGIHGLARHLRDHRVDVLIDATHPFASGITANASGAAELAAVRYMRLERPPWDVRDKSNVTHSASLAALFGLLPGCAVVFAPLGKSADSGKTADLIRSRPDVQFAMRSIAAPEAAIPGNVSEWILRRPPFSLDDEIETLRRLSADGLLCRNAGGEAGFTKIEAASRLGLKIFLLTPPRPHQLPPHGEVFTHADELFRAVRRASSQNRQSRRPDA